MFFTKSRSDVGTAPSVQLPEKMSSGKMLGTRKECHFIVTTQVNIRQLQGTLDMFYPSLHLATLLAISA